MLAHKCACSDSVISLNISTPLCPSSICSKHQNMFGVAENALCGQSSVRENSESVHGIHK